MTRAGDRILKAANEALAFAEGKADIADFKVHAVSAPDIRAIRSKTGLSQAMFAKTFAISKRALEEWEQGKRSPSGPAAVLLRVIDREPQAVLRALAGG